MLSSQGHTGTAERENLLAITEGSEIQNLEGKYREWRLGARPRPARS